MIQEMLSRIKCRLGRHDDVPIPLDDEAWKVYCRHCERLAYDIKGVDAKRAREDEEFKKFIKTTLAAGNWPMATTKSVEERTPNDSS